MFNFEKFLENWNYLKDIVFRYFDLFFNFIENVYFNVLNIILVEIIIKVKEYI